MKWCSSYSQKQNALPRGRMPFFHLHFFLLACIFLSCNHNPINIRNDKFENSALNDLGTSLAPYVTSANKAHFPDELIGEWISGNGEFTIKITKNALHEKSSLGLPFSHRGILLVQFNLSGEDKPSYDMMRPTFLSGRLYIRGINLVNYSRKHRLDPSMKFRIPLDKLDVHDEMLWGDSDDLYFIKDHQ